MKRKYIIILICIIILAVFGGWLYFVSMFSSVYPPIKEYKFKVSASTLRSTMINVLDNLEKYDYNFKDTVGNVSKGYSYYINLKIKGQKMDDRFTFKFYSKKLQPDISKIDLIGAFDNINKTGGYKLKDPDVKKLVEVFEMEFINKLGLKNTLK